MRSDTCSNVRRRSRTQSSRRMLRSSSRSCSSGGILERQAAAIAFLHRSPALLADLAQAHLALEEAHSVDGPQLDLLGLQLPLSMGSLATWLQGLKLFRKLAKVTLAVRLGESINTALSAILDVVVDDDQLIMEGQLNKKIVKDIANNRRKGQLLPRPGVA